MAVTFVPWPSVGGVGKRPQGGVYYCDTEAEKPEGGLHNGDVAVAADSGLRYVYDGTAVGPTWKEVDNTDELPAASEPYADDAVATGITDHEGAVDPHPTYETAAEASALDAAAIAAHAALADPHPVYETAAEAGALDTAAIAAHAAAGDPHADRAYADTVAAGVLPAGMWVPFGGVAAPSGWLLCDGTSYLRADYPDLFAAIDVAYGSADGTHFNVPDLRGAFVLGKAAAGTGSVLGEAGGSIDHDHVIPGHGHAFTQPGGHSAHVVTQPDNHGALAHAGSAVANHAVTQPNAHDAHVVSQPNAHSAHVVTQPSAHSAHVVTQPSAHAVTQPSAHSAHAVTQPSAHSAHAVTQPSAHSDHAVTQPSAHSAHAALATHAHELPFIKLAGATGVLRMLASSIFGTGTSRAPESVSAAPTANTTAAAVELSQAVTGGTPDAHSAHAGSAVDAHSAHAGSAVDAHSAHAGGAVDAHSAHAGAAVDAHAGAAVDAHSAHAATAVDAHSAHAGAGVDAHSAHAGSAVDAHGVTQPNNHGAQAHANGAVDAHSAHAGGAVTDAAIDATDQTNPPYVTANYIIKT